MTTNKEKLFGFVYFSRPLHVFFMLMASKCEIIRSLLTGARLNLHVLHEELPNKFATANILM